MMHLSALLSAVAFIPAVAGQDLTWIHGSNKMGVDFGANDAKIGENGTVNYGNFKFDNAGNAPLLILYRVTEGKFDCDGDGDRDCWAAIPGDQKPRVGADLPMDGSLILGQLQQRIDSLGDLRQYPGQHLVVWCRTFGVLFGYARIPTTAEFNASPTPPHQFPVTTTTTTTTPSDVCTDTPTGLPSGFGCSKILFFGLCQVDCPNVGSTFGQYYCRRTCSKCDSY